MHPTHRSSSASAARCRTTDPGSPACGPLATSGSARYSRNHTRASRLALTSGTDIECFGSNGPSNLNVAFAGASGNSSEEFEDPPPTLCRPWPPARADIACVAWRSQSFRSTRARRITLALASRPVQCRMPITPWLTSMPKPSATRQLRACASRRRRVSGGLWMPSATTM